ncbi:MAG: hypothetical protein SLAVMIC_00108 [uncultured marine phage]|uniref:Uncharacterized protein n=1 Tax=uncultured marine phage TaxID=707152 RepID=A0A8D9C8D0_9VIRU|nr:MAG: hypothetical protein SLAVMIC_00108 [uncultured marine phage]
METEREKAKRVYKEAQEKYEKNKGWEDEMDNQALIATLILFGVPSIIILIIMIFT